MAAAGRNGCRRSSWQSFMRVVSLCRSSSALMPTEPEKTNRQVVSLMRHARSQPSSCSASRASRAIKSPRNTENSSSSISSGFVLRRCCKSRARLPHGASASVCNSRPPPIPPGSRRSIFLTVGITLTARFPNASKRACMDASGKALSMAAMKPSAVSAPSTSTMADKSS